MTSNFLERVRDARRFYFPHILVAASLVPVAYMLVRGFLASRNVAYWDEFDSALRLVLRLDTSTSWSDMFRELFAVANEHRMVTSRFLFAVSYWTTGTVNFVAIGVIGNLFICGLCVLLIATAGTIERKLGMTALLAAFLFQLEHFENFFWSGSSIDHFQVVLLAGAAFVALARGTWNSLSLASVFGLLATFTLAHGVVIWPVGLLLLIAERRWWRAAFWLLLSVLAVAAFLSGFTFNPDHRVDDFSAFGLWRILRYWLELLGAPLAFGNLGAAIGLGLLLLVLLVRQILRGGLARERIVLPLALWAVGGLTLMAIGRVNVSGGMLSSRYYVLGALAWALVLFVEIGTWQDVQRPWRVLGRVLPLLVVFNVAANFVFANDARAWIDRRDRAVEAYLSTGADGAGADKLYPVPRQATRLIQQAEEAGLYQMPKRCEERTFAQTKLKSEIACAIDRVEVGRQLITIEGWAALNGQEAKRGQIHVVLKSPTTQRVFTTLPVERSDVVAAFPQQRWTHAGFRFELRPWLIPQEDYEIGVLIRSERGNEYTMTPRRLELARDGRVIGADMMDANGNFFDELRMQGPMAKVTGESNKVKRVSFFDVYGNLIYVDLIGTGTLTISLTQRSPSNSEVEKMATKPAYMKGLAGIVVEGADETTSLHIVAAPPRWRTNSPWCTGLHPGIAHVAYVAISSRNGNFGTLRAGNARFSAQKGFTGVYAPDVRFNGGLFVGDVNAFRSAIPMLIVGSVADARITGGDLLQNNRRPVEVEGLLQLHFVAGRTSHGVRLAAKRNRGVLQQGGADISAHVVWDAASGPRGFNAAGHDPRLMASHGARLPRGTAEE